VTTIFTSSKEQYGSGVDVVMLEASSIHTQDGMNHIHIRRRSLSVLFAPSPGSEDAEWLTVPKSAVWAKFKVTFQPIVECGEIRKYGASADFRLANRMIKIAINRMSTKSDLGGTSRGINEPRDMAATGRK